MAVKSKELRHWQQMIGHGLKAREIQAQSKLWPRWDKYYASAHPGYEPSGPGGGFGLYANFMFAMIRGMVPRVYFRNPRMIVTSTMPGREGHARIVEHLCNWMIREMGVKQIIKRSILHAALYGTGVIKHGYDSEYAFREIDQIGDIDLPSSITRSSDATLTQLDDKLDRIEYDERIQPGRPWIKSVWPENIIFDPTATDPKEISWIMHRFRRRLKDVKTSAYYDNTSSLKANMTAPVAEDSFDFTSGDAQPSEGGSRGEPQEEEWVELFEVSDYKSGKVYVLSRDHDSFLRNEDDALQVEGLPYHFTIFNEQPQYAWGISDAFILMPQQMELNDIRNMQQQYRKFNRIIGVIDPGAFDPTEEEKLFSENPVAFLKGKSDGEIRDLSKAINFVTKQIPADMAFWGREVINDMQTIYGMGQNQLGQYDKSTRRTATEAGIVAQGSAIRADERRDAIADTLVSIMRKSIQMIFKFWSEPRVAQVIGPEALRFWVKYTGPELRGEYSYRIEPDDTAPMTAAQRRQEAMALFEIARTLPPEMINHPAVLKHLIDQFDSLDSAAVVAQQQAPNPKVQNLQDFNEILRTAPPEAPNAQV